MTMLLRQFATKRAKNALTTFISRNIQDASPNKQWFIAANSKLNSMGNRPLPLPLLVNEIKNISNCDECASPKTFASSINGDRQVVLDPLMNERIKEIFVPSIAANILKVYYDNPLNINKNIIDPRKIDQKYIDVPLPGRPLKKDAVRMIRIRRRKMRKHKLRKLRKRMKLVFEKIRMQRELRKEQIFRSELLTQIEEAQEFDAKAHVNDIIHTLRYYPKPETIEERRERFRQLRKKNLSNTVFIKPRFDV